MATPNACPSADAVAAAILRLAPGTRIVGEDAAASVILRIEDHGDAFHVAIEGAGREVRDRRRQCAERARAAAVFLVLALEPPRVDVRGHEPPAAVVQLDDDEPNPLRMRPAGPRAHAWSLELEGGALATTAPANRGIATGGGTLRLVVGSRSFGATLGAAGVGPVTLGVAPGQVRLQRVPLDVGAYAALRRERLDARVELGLALAPLIIRGEGYSANLDATRLDVGIRGALLGRWWLAPRLALWLGAEVTGLPRPYDLVVANREARAHSPTVWLSVGAGLAVRID